MAICYLFADHLDEEHGLCLCLDERGVVVMPLAHRTLEEIRAIQENMRMIVVLSAIHSTLHRVELPWLNDRKARAAIPYALEDQLAQNVSDLHFAFDRQHYRHNHYLVVVTDTHFLEKMIERLDALNIDFDTMTLDWFALNDQEGCLTDNALLVCDESFKGALGIELVPLFLNANHESLTLLKCRDSAQIEHTDRFNALDETSYHWIAGRLFLKEGINLCQGALRHDTRTESTQFWYWASGVLVGLWLLSWVCINAYHLHVLKTQTAKLDEEIATIYHEFYPNDKHVVSPEFRVRQLLHSDSMGQNEAFWPLLEKLSHTLNPSEFTIIQMRFQNKVLSLTLTASDFAALEGLELQLQKKGVKVTQLEASSSTHKVLATLELSL